MSPTGKLKLSGGRVLCHVTLPTTPFPPSAARLPVDPGTLPSQDPLTGCSLCLYVSALFLASSSAQISPSDLQAQPGTLSHYAPNQTSIMLTIKLLLLCLCDDWFNKCSPCQMRHTSSLSHSCVPHTKEAAFNTSLSTLSLLTPSLAYNTPDNVVSSLSPRLFLASGSDPTHYFYLECSETFWALLQCSGISQNILDQSVPLLKLGHHLLKEGLPNLLVKAVPCLPGHSQPLPL